MADSRYELRVNGQRMQWGPAPCDPRWTEADPIDLTDLLEQGRNVLGATVLHYGHGDGTWPIGTPGFLFYLQIEHADGRLETLASDANWGAHLCRAWPVGQHKRWYLRALQEEFDARLYPYGWDTAVEQADGRWRPAMVLPGSPNKPAICAGYPDYLTECGPVYPQACTMRPRQVPLMRETMLGFAKLSEQCWLQWNCPPRDYFDCMVPDAFSVDRRPCAQSHTAGKWEVDFSGTASNQGALLTFELPEQGVGWPRFVIEASEGTTVEMLVHEAHAVGGPVVINSHFHSWTRFICKAGRNVFESFDYESCRWIQLHIHGAAGKVSVSDIGLRRRLYPWPHPANVAIGEPALQRLMDAAINTLNNSCHETVVDGVARERQQYSGDGAHQLHAIWLAMGDTQLPARFMSTFSQGMTRSGYFLDCWPAFDRLNRVMCREIDLASWGPILDHGVGFVFDNYYHYLYTADTRPLRETYPRLVKFANYLRTLVRQDGLLPVEDIGVPCVWIDHAGFGSQRHKQCAFNLYAAAMLANPLTALARLMGDETTARFGSEWGQELLKACTRRFWSREHRIFVDNLPWLAEEQTLRLHDRTLGTAVLYDQCPSGDVHAAVKAMVELPAHMGQSYPANANWRLWALAKVGRGDVLLADLREHWAKMDSVLLNNTLAEEWHPQPDSGSQWSHCPLVPLYVTYMNIAGIRPVEPGFARAEIRPQLGDLASLRLTVPTVRGPIEFEAHGAKGKRALSLEIPAACNAELLVAEQEQLDLPRVAGPSPAGTARFQLPPGERVSLNLAHT